MAGAVLDSTGNTIMDIPLPDGESPITTDFTYGLSNYHLDAAFNSFGTWSVKSPQDPSEILFSALASIVRQVTNSNIRDSCSVTYTGPGVAGDPLLGVVSNDNSAGPFSSAVFSTCNVWIFCE